MRRIRLEAMGEGHGEETTYAQVRAFGVALPAGPIAFELEPAARRIAAPLPEGWPAGVLVAVRAKSHDDGFDILIGADILRGAAIPPGMGVVVRFPELGVFGEVFWPRVEALQRPRRRNIVVARASRASPGRPAATAIPVATAEPIIPLASDTAPVAMETISPEPEADAASLRVATAAPLPVAAVGVAETVSGTDGRPRDDVSASDAGDVAARPVAPPADTVMPRSSVPSFATGMPAHEQPRAAQGEPEWHSAAPARRRFPFDRRIAAGLAVGVVLGGTLLFGRGPEAESNASSPRDPARPTAARAVVSAGAARHGPESPSSLFDALSTGLVSPKGASAKEVRPERALEIAVAQLAQPPGHGDGEESQYWLKRYVVTSLGDERMQRALTRIGTLYAEPPGGAPDYGRARVVWELASAAGDPVAMCFIGLLHEHGLGLPVSRKGALEWFDRAKQAGGCSGLDDAIARVK